MLPYHVFMQWHNEIFHFVFNSTLNDGQHFIGLFGYPLNIETIFWEKYLKLTPGSLCCNSCNRAQCSKHIVEVTFSQCTLLCISQHWSSPATFLPTFLALQVLSAAPHCQIGTELPKIIQYHLEILLFPYFSPRSFMKMLSKNRASTDPFYSEKWPFSPALFPIF